MPPSPEPDETRLAPITVVVAVSDRETRKQWSQALLDAGYLVRVATRAAEVAKALADGTARVVLRRDHHDDQLLTVAAQIEIVAVPANELPLTHLHTALADGER